MIDAVHRYDGYIVQSTGDGIFALFGAPVAHEDHPQRALYAALRMQEEMTALLGASGRRGGNLPIEGRVGVNTGEVVVRSITTGGGHTEYTPIGHTTNLASRMQALAPTGSIAVSEADAQAGRRLFRAQAARADQGQRRQRAGQRLRGDGARAAAHAAAALGGARADEVRRARARDGRDAARRRAGARRVTGRSSRRWRRRASASRACSSSSRPSIQSGWMVLEAFSVSHGKASAYLPVIDLLHSYFRIAAKTTSARGARRSTARYSSTLDRCAGRHAALSVRAARHRRRRRSAGADGRAGQASGARSKRSSGSCCARSLNQPLMVIFEDLHWIDEETQAFLNLLADSIGTAKILLLVNYRPEYSHQWNSKTYYTQLRLDPLGKESADEMLSALLGDERRSWRRSSG